ncbi:hypothetical protein J5N97_002634 [Dioscorea zingiberensis]|uniref:Uncharacterized protein n=1 Tax=Dioscorea zingiberensis TaxID=325984 RepID=A0A9D5D547_9LILI|nr:hypothetical protein J5N97_002634 [Dioscorea zingiberensis]
MKASSIICGVIFVALLLSACKGDEVNDCVRVFGCNEDLCDQQCFKAFPTPGSFTSSCTDVGECQCSVSS